MTEEERVLFSDLRRVIEGPAWLRLIQPALEQERNDALAGMTDLKKTAAERGEFAHAYNVAKRLAELVPDRMKELQAKADELMKKR